MKLCKQILLLILVFQIFVGQSAVLALPDDVSAQEGTPEKKVFLNEMFLRHLSMPDGTIVRKSGWDLGVTGGSVADTAGLQLLDTSNTLPVTAEHQLESIDSGKVTLEINFRVGSQIPGAEISMRHGMTPVLQLQFTDTGVSFVDAWGQQKSLFSIYPQYPWVYYDVRVIADFDTGLADVYHENALVASKLLFARHMSVDNVYISTGEQAVGNLNLSTVRIYKGYPLWEDGNWELDNDGIGWTFETVNHSCVFESQLLIPNQDGETQISIRLHDKDILTLNADTKAFYVSSDTRPISAFYEYQKNVWYILRAEFNMLHQTADIKLNGRYVVRDIPVSADGIDSIVITSSHAEAKAGYAKLFYQQLPNDYVPPPNKVSSTEYLIGMQSFPMFTEGTSVGWDWINDAPGRKPLLGFYDGQLPETADWTIKWLAEHGIDYQWFVWHQFAQLGQPVQYSGEDPTVQDGYMHAKYADILKYGILWENASSNIYGSDRAANRESFLAYTVPYWLEYFLKDSRYVQLNGRPLIGIYSYSTLASAFGSPSEIKQLFDSFREMCSQNGVGDPIIVQHVAAGTSEAALDEMYQSGIDAVYMYAQGDPYPEAQADANAGLCANAKNMQYIPSFTMGYDAFAWGRGTNVKLTGGQFYECLQHAKDNLLPDLPNRIGGTKKPVMLTTWDEFG